MDGWQHTCQGALTSCTTILAPSGLHLNCAVAFNSHKNHGVPPTTKSLSPESRPTCLACLATISEQRSPRIPTQAQDDQSSSYPTARLPLRSRSAHTHAPCHWRLTGDGTGLQLPESFSIVRTPLHAVPLGRIPKITERGSHCSILSDPAVLHCASPPSSAISWAAPFRPDPAPARSQKGR